MVTKQIFNGIKSIVNGGHSRASAHRLADDAINSAVGAAIGEFIARVMGWIDEAASNGLYELRVEVPSFGNIDEEIETLLKAHLERRKFTVEPMVTARTFRVKW